jgi:outer membrane protein
MFELETELEKGSIAGAGVMYAQSPYEDMDDTLYFAPVLVMEYKQFFIDATVLGYYLNPREDDFRVGLILSPRFQGYDSDDATALNGMEDREWAVDGGMRATWKTEMVNISAQAVADISGTHKGGEISVTFSKRFLDGLLMPRAGISWQSGDLNDYYYGVKASEATANRPEYEADSDIEYIIGLTTSVPVGEKWAVVGDMQCNFLGSNVQDSPIVNNETPMRYILGAVYRF